MLLLYTHIYTSIHLCIHSIIYKRLMKAAWDARSSFFSFAFLFIIVKLCLNRIKYNVLITQHGKSKIKRYIVIIFVTFTVNLTFLTVSKNIFCSNKLRKMNEIMMSRKAAKVHLMAINDDGTWGQKQYLNGKFSKIRLHIEHATREISFF